MTTRAWLGILLAVLAGVLGAAGWLRCEGGQPVLRGPERLFVGRGKTTVQVEARDSGSGIRRLELRVKQGPTRERIAEVAERSAEGA